MKIVLIIIAIFIAQASKANAGLLFPWNPIIKLNLGLDYVSPSFSGYSKNGNGFGKDVSKFKNINAYAGLRLFRYFGLEAGYSRLGGDFSKNDISYDTTIKNSYIDAKLFFPILSLSAINLDGYFSVGQAYIDGTARIIGGSETSNSQIHTSTKLGFGLESDLFGIASARIGWYTTTRKLEIFEMNRLNAVYGGFSVYIL